MFIIFIFIMSIIFTIVFIIFTLRWWWCTDLEDWCV